MGLPMRNIHSDLPSQVIVLLPLVTGYKLNKIFTLYFLPYPLGPVKPMHSPFSKLQLLK